MKLLLSVFDLGDSLGEQRERRGQLVYGTVSTDTESQSTTLKYLADEVRAMGLPAAPTAVIGLSLEGEGVALSSPAPSDLPDPLAEVLGSPTIVFPKDGENDLQPLYFVPWIPEIEDSQDPKLHSDGLRELTARVLTQAIGHVGRVHIPIKLTLNGNQLLSDATFGVFKQWREQNRKLYSKKAATIVERALKKTQVEIRRYEGEHLEIYLPTEETKNKAIKALELADPADPTKNLETESYEQLSLLDGS